MKLLLDTCVWGGAYKELKGAGHDVVWVGNWPKDPGDEEILEYACNEDRILVTLDKDFGELAIVHDTPHSGILRIVNFPAQKQGKICQHVLNKFGKVLHGGAIVTAEQGRIRIRE
ncbi:MAG: toxin-antitoxin system, toxin component, PIN family protein [Planctomycetes bacterium]|nr:toxin-antitoxin system, toxin component, PIN family protein [Planctomycetota bacterium]